MEVIVLSVLGFLIQMGSSVLLCFLPFGKSDFRLRSGAVYLSAAALVSITSLCFPVTLVITDNISLENTNVVYNFYMLAAILLFTVFYFTVIKTEFIKKLLVLLLVVFYAAAQYIVVNMGIAVFVEELADEPYTRLTVLLYGVTTAVFLPLYSYIMKKNLGDYLAEVEVKNIRHEFLTILLITAAYLFMLMIYSSIPVSNMTEFWWWITPAFLLSIIILLVFYGVLFRESVRRKRDGERQKSLEIQKVQYERFIQEMELTRRMRHDMRHHLNTLYSMLEDGETKQMEEYISTLIDRTSRRDTDTYCLNHSVNALLQYYMGQARDEGIRCKVSADCSSVDVETVDLTVLLGNTLENAIKACRKATEPHIYVQIGVINEKLLIKVVNSCKNVNMAPNWEQGGEYYPAEAFASDRGAVGYGLKSISATAQKYGGIAEFKYDEKTEEFKTRIFLTLDRAQGD